MKTSHFITLATYILCVFISSFFYLQKRDNINHYQHLGAQLEETQTELMDRNKQITELKRQLYASNKNYALSIKPYTQGIYPQIQGILSWKSDIFTSELLSKKQTTIDFYQYKDQEIIRKSIGGITASNGLPYYVSILRYPSAEFLIANVVPESLIPTGLNSTLSPLINAAMWQTKEIELVEKDFMKHPKFLSKNRITFYNTDNRKSYFTYKTLLFSPRNDLGFSQISISYQPLPNTDPTLQEIDRGLKEIANSLRVEIPKEEAI